MGAKKLEGICLPAFGYCQQLRMVCDLVHISEITFPKKGVRFIAINGGVDSEDQPSNDFTPFRNIMNELVRKRHQ